MSSSDNKQRGQLATNAKIAVPKAGNLSASNGGASNSGNGGNGKGGRVLLFGKLPLVAFFGLSLLSLVLPFIIKPKAGVDFAGGVVITFRSSTVLDSHNFDEIVARLGKSSGTKDFSIQGGDGVFSIRFRDEGSSGTLYTDRFKSGISEVFSGVVFESVDSIGPQVSKGLVWQSLTAMLFAMFAIVVYLLIQFNWHFALSGVGVLLCDVLITAGFVTLVGFELNLTLVAAFLTLIGYCINDTVVLYDRIRSNLKTSPSPTEEVFKRSVSEVLRRSFATSIVTMIGVAGILFFADEAIVHFAWTIMFGIAVGTFGSVYIAPSLPLLMGFKKKQKVAVVRDKMFYAS